MSSTAAEDTVLKGRYRITPMPPNSLGAGAGEAGAGQTTDNSVAPKKKNNKTKKNKPKPAADVRGGATDEIENDDPADEPDTPEMVGKPQAPGPSSTCPPLS
jgi:hypothetical protein